MNLQHYALLAELFFYPQADFLDRVMGVQSFLDEGHPLAGIELTRFRSLLPKGDLRALQELYTRSFDIQAITTLDIGYILFGDDYKRGELLANLNREHQQVNNPCDSELADHLPNILNLLSRQRDGEAAQELVQELLAVSLRRMIGEFEPAQLDKKDELYKKHHKTLIDTSQQARTAYHYALRALYEVLCIDFRVDESAMIERTPNFLDCLRSEMTLETRVTRQLKPETRGTPWTC